MLLSLVWLSDDDDACAETREKKLFEHFMLVAVDVDVWFVLLALFPSRLCLAWIIHKWYLPEAGLGPIKIVLHVMSEGGFESSALDRLFWCLLNEVIRRRCMRCRLCRWQQSLIDSPFSPCHSCLSSCQTKRQLYVDLLYIGISLFPFLLLTFPFGNLKISCQKVYCLVFRMRLSLHILWLMGILFSSSFFPFRNPVVHVSFCQY